MILRASDTYFQLVLQCQQDKDTIFPMWADCNIWFSGNLSNIDYDDLPSLYKIRNAVLMDDSAIVELSGEAAASIVVTKTADDFGVHNTKNGKDLIRIPAFAFLYLLGHAEKHGYCEME